MGIFMGVLFFHGSWKNLKTILVNGKIKRDMEIVL